MDIFCHPLNARLEVNTSIKSPGLKRRFQYPVQVRGQGNPKKQNCTACIFIKARRGGKLTNRVTQRLFITVYLSPLAFRKPVNTVRLALVGMETQVHTRKTLTAHKTQTQRGSEGKMSFLFPFWREQQAVRTFVQQQRKSAQLRKTRNTAALNKTQLSPWQSLYRQLNPRQGSHKGVGGVSRCRSEVTI